MRLALVLPCAFLAACRSLPEGAEARSLFGRPLYPPPIAEAERARRAEALERALAEWKRAPQDPDALLWAGRRFGYVNRFRAALEVFSTGVRQHPDDARMWRFRGHRHITLREFGAAERDLERAAELISGAPDSVEPAGLPNERGIDLDYLQHSVWYHLGLALYLQGDFARALDAWQRCRAVSRNPDALCSATHWLYMTLRRLGREPEARSALEPISAGMDIVEYHAYHRLLLVYRGELDADELLARTREESPASVDHATIGYGVGNWHLYQGRRERAVEVFREVLQNPNWHSFGSIASEVELKRLGLEP